MHQEIKVKFKTIGRPKTPRRPYIPKAKTPRTPRRPAKLVR